MASSLSKTPSRSYKVNRGQLEKLRVAVRIRPSSSQDVAFVAEHSAKTIIELDSDEGNVVSTSSFDHVFDGSCGTRQIYEEVGGSMVESALEGYNGTLFAYGQTASGKTHTLMGTIDEPGIVPLSIQGIFDAISRAMYSKIIVRVSYIEVYNEELRDLLSSDDDGEKLKIVDDPQTGPWVHAARHEIAPTAEDCMKIFEFGEKQRSYGSTSMNDHSSRSHVLFRITIKRGFSAPNQDGERKDWETDPNTATRVSVLNFVDLAGSERLKKTGATGQVLKEANAINKSLMTLGSVISKLAEGDASHVPFRDSKLTHLLSGSLGGNSLTTMVACISPQVPNREESNNTLRYASRANKITTDGSINTTHNLDVLLAMHSDESDELRRNLAECQAMLSAQKSELDEVGRLSHRGGADEDLMQQIDKLTQELELERMHKSTGGEENQEGMVSREAMEHVNALWEEELRLMEAAAEQQRKDSERLVAKERVAAAAREAEIMAQLTAASVGNTGVVISSLWDEVKRQKAEIEELRGGGKDGKVTAGSLTGMLLAAEKQLEEAQATVSQLRAELVNAQQVAVVQGQTLGAEINTLRKELRQVAAAHGEHANFDVPNGYVLWFHAHCLPRIFALSEPENAHVLLRPHASAPVVARGLPLGATVEVDLDAVAVAKHANPSLDKQLARLVPNSLPSKAFWLHYFSHVHAIKAHVASQARARAAHVSGSDPQLLATFTSVLQEGILVRRHKQDGAVALTKLWLTGNSLMMLEDGESNPESLNLDHIARVTTGKSGGRHRAIDELTLNLITENHQFTFEASARLEIQALIEGFALLLSN